jgi:hypothetical protein
MRQQLDLLPGNPADTAQALQHRANAPLRPAVAQEPPGGLFGDAAAQIDLIDLLRRG